MNSPPQTRRSPGATGLRDHTTSNFLPQRNTASDPLQQLLDRLEGVVKTGGGYRACCPNCGGKSRKVSVTTGQNGTLLVTCFNCHDTPAVLAAIGLQMSDLFQRRDISTMTQAERSQMRQAALLPRWRAALAVLTGEATVLLIAANQLADGVSLSDADLTRVRVAALKVFDASEVLNAR